jgi:hypothetical protein
MDKEQEEAVQQITACYISESRAGQHPRLSDYLSRYPQYADAITGLVTYFHAMEVNHPEEMKVIAPLSETSRAALDEAWKRVLYTESVDKSDLTSLLKATHNVNKSLSQLAMDIGLSLDILKKFEQHGIDAASIPQEVCNRLAKVLQLPLAAIEKYLGFTEHKQLAQSIAEAQTSYYAEAPTRSNIQTQSFRQAVEQSMHLSNEQKVTWRSILEKEGLL